ncbi:MAG: sigma-70 family RNA polymerase sigma factor [Pirellulales bacterium]
MVEDADSTEAWVGRLRTEQERALAELFSKHRDRLWQIASFRIDRRLAGRLDVDDILQEAYLSAAQRIDHYLANPKVSPFVWLRMIVGQTMVDLHRRHLGAGKRDVKREVSLRAGFSPESTSMSLAAHMLECLTTPSQLVAREELERRLEATIAAMDHTDREVLALRHFEELSNSEVAEVLNISQAAASVRYVRALAKLKKILSGLPEWNEQEEAEGSEGDSSGSTRLGSR